MFCVFDLKLEQAVEEELETLPYLTFFFSFFFPSNGNLGMGDNGVKNVGSNLLCLGVRPLRFHHFIRKWLISPLERPDKDCTNAGGVKVQTVFDVLMLNLLKFLYVH